MLSSKDIFPLLLIPKINKGKSTTTEIKHWREQQQQQNNNSHIGGNIQQQSHWQKQQLWKLFKRNSYNLKTLFIHPIFPTPTLGNIKIINLFSSC